MDGYDESTDRAAKFLGLTKRYKEFTELTPATLHRFVDRIEVHERTDRRTIATTQKVDIFLNFIGAQNLSSLILRTYTPLTHHSKLRFEWTPGRSVLCALPGAFSPACKIVSRKRFLKTQNGIAVVGY